MPVEGEDAANPYGFRLALDAGGVDFPRTSSDRTVGEAMDGVVKVVKELHRATHMEDDIGRILNEVRAADRVASADERFVYDDRDESGGSRIASPRRRHR